MILFLGLIGCGRPHKKAEPLSPPEPIHIKEDMPSSAEKSEGDLPIAENDPLSSSQPEWLSYTGDGTYRLGKPYKVNGIWYFPAENLKYDEIGFASWYGNTFHNRLTANGEVFNKHALTAAHKTLPLPSIVRVTNLENGKSVVVRINDRGPFVNDRLIDLSEQAAKMIDFPTSNTLKVRVEILPEESKAAVDRIRGQTTPILPTPPLPQSSDSSPTPGAPTNSQAIPDPVSANPSRENEDALNNLFDGEPATQTNPSDSPIENPTPPSPPTSEAFLQPPPPLLRVFVVQVGTFKKKENASALSQKLAIAGPTSVSPLLRNGETLYKVQSGPFQDRIQAQNALHHIKSLGIGDAKILEKSS